MPRVNRGRKIHMKTLRTRGYSYGAIARIMKIKERQVRFHLKDTEKERKKRNEYQRRRRKSLSLEQREKERNQVSECNKKRYQNDPKFRKTIAEKLVRSRRKKKGYIEHPPKCSRCGLKIEKYNNLERIKATSKEAKELLRIKYGRTLSVHKTCWALVPKRERRILEGNDWTSFCLNINNEIWVRLDEEGNKLWTTMWSDIEEVDQKLKGILGRRKEGLRAEDQETLKKILNEM